MNDTEHPSDYIPTKPHSASLSPTQKFATGIWTDIFLLLILSITLAGVYVSAVKPEFFEKVILGILFIVATKIAPKWIEHLPFLRK